MNVDAEIRTLEAQRDAAIAAAIDQYQGEIDELRRIARKERNRQRMRYFRSNLEPSVAALLQKVATSKNENEIFTGAERPGAVINSQEILPGLGYEVKRFYVGIVADRPDGWCFPDGNDLKRMNAGGRLWLAMCVYTADTEYYMRRIADLSVGSRADLAEQIRKAERQLLVAKKIPGKWEPFWQ